MVFRADSDTQIYFQIGDPLRFATAAVLHNAMFAYANVNAVSINKVVKKGELGRFIEDVKDLDIDGFDITMPHKQDVIPFLDEMDDISREFQSVNHVNYRNGKLIGTTLDGIGMRLAIEAEGVDLRGKNVLILGAGGVTGPVAAEICKAGASRMAVLNRTPEKAETLAGQLEKHFAAEFMPDAMTPETLCRYAREADVVVQCTCLGMLDKHVDFEDLSFVGQLPPHAFVADCVIFPERTSLLRAAESRGIRGINGFGMLIWQQKAMLKFHCGVDVDDGFYDAGEEAIYTALALRAARDQRDARRAAGK